MAIERLQPRSLARIEPNILTSSSSVTLIIASASSAPASLRSLISRASPHNIVFWLDKLFAIFFVVLILLSIILQLISG